MRNKTGRLTNPSETETRLARRTSIQTRPTYQFDPLRVSVRVRVRVGVGVRLRLRLELGLGSGFTHALFVSLLPRVNVTDDIRVVQSRNFVHFYTQSKEKYRVPK